MGQDLDALKELLAIMKKLRDKREGCPWDIEQDHYSLRKYVIEEAYEVAEAIDQGDSKELKAELGDLLLQVVFHAQIAEENGTFNFSDIARSISTKMIDRHPHVFQKSKARTTEQQSVEWEKTKEKERRAKGARSELDDVAGALPALTRSYKLQKRAARVGFDWSDIEDVKAKLDEEFQEFEEANSEQKIDEFGDILFTIVNYGRHLKIDPEEALSRTNQKFTRRFQFIETELIRSGKEISKTQIEELERLWQKSKQNERSN